METNMEGVGLGTSLQARDRMWFPKNKPPIGTVLWPIAFTSESLTHADTCYSCIEKEIQGILHSLEKFHLYCFACDITDHKPLVVILNKKCCKPITQATKNTMADILIKHQNIM